MKRYVMTFVCLLFVCSMLIVMFHMETSNFFGVWPSEKVPIKTSGVYPFTLGRKRSLEKEFHSTNGGLNCTGIHNLSCEEPYFSRLRHVQEECKKKPPEDYSLLSVHYKFSDKLKLIMCETPKVASTALQKIMIKMDTSFKERKSWTPQHDCGKWGNKCFTELTEKEARLRTNTYTSFLISRHPLERVVSAYVNKLLPRNSNFRRWIGIPAALQQASLHLHGVGRGEDLIKMKNDDIKALQRFKKLSSSHQNEVLNYVNVMRSGAISFSQLVRFVVDHYVEGKIDRIDRHWKPQVDICKPCAFNYSYIMRFDDLAKDVNRMWDYVVDYQKFNVSKKDIHISFRETKVGHNPVATEYYKQVPENHVKILRDLYEDDFVFYNYDPYLYHGY